MVATAVRAQLGVDGDLEGLYGTPVGDAGYFGADSVVWKVHADLPSMMIGGISALLYQTLHPLAMAGVAQHSTYRTDRLGRLRRTAHFIAGTTFGPTVVADALVERVRAVHERVVGVAASGEAYRANDPALLAFVHATEVDGFVRSYQRYATRPLVRAEKDRYVEEMGEIAVRLGAVDPPCSLDQLRAYLRRCDGALELTAEASEAVTFLRRAETSNPSEVVAHHILFAAALDLLPAQVRRHLGPTVSVPPTGLAVRFAASVLASGLRLALGPSEIRAIAERRVAASPKVRASH